MVRFGFGVLLTALVVVGCGDDNGANRDGGILRDGDGSIIDGDGSVVDGDGSVIPPAQDFDGGVIVVPADCTAESAQCNNCIDDDEDGLIDGADFECVSPLDNDESSFATGIPGDNKDATKQDCFFDGDSGGGNDGCNVHVCCLLPGPCDDNKFDETKDCTVSSKCASNCGAITPPGCDCFGCCTLCDDSGCYDILINPAISPNCDETTISDPDVCTVCNKIDACGPPDCAAPDDCILCPGENPENLPAECGGVNECPNGQQTCAVSADCTNNGYCNQGCCNDGYVIP